MGFKCTMLSYSPTIPRENITTKPEGGVEAASEQITKYFEGEWRFDRTGDLDEAFNPTDESLWVGTWGDTVVFTGEETLGYLVDEPADNTWFLFTRSMMDACSYRTPPNHRGRVVDLDDSATAEDKVAALEGDLLPFEEPFARGDHNYDDDPEYGYHPLDLAESAVLWIFGTEGEGASEDEVSAAITPIDPEKIILHRFVPAGTPERSKSAGGKKKGFFSRLFG
ncbi:hypothetical protein JOD55_000661 [Arcanobacterium pluranimalium]|uniref:DUF6928 family protein n=1 Tax=Arcanobacterium pluranimalium TaxID=108028 RepID=UPI00195EC8A8|nr:hypothetical protein [Arcanobacterium pluranimalium]MBM7824834.1 hypothetical protein [Arcanobacterium pluranimalium]